MRIRPRLVGSALHFALSAQISALSVSAIGVVAAGGRDVVGVLTELYGVLSSAHAHGVVNVVNRHISVPFSGVAGHYSHLNSFLELCLQLGFFRSELLVDEKLRLLLVNFLELSLHLLHRHLLVGHAFAFLLLPFELFLQLLLSLLMLEQPGLGHGELGLNLVLLGKHQHADGPSLALRHQRWRYIQQSVVVGDCDLWLYRLPHLMSSRDIVEGKYFILAL